MKLKLLSIFIPILIISLTGCTTKAYFYPVEGKYKEMIPYPVIEATVDGIMGNTGNISLTLPNNEFCQGRWSSVAPIQVSYSNGSASGHVTNGMSSAWGTVYGSSYSVSNLAGINKGSAMMSCDQGTVIDMEFYTGSGTANGNGVAKDNKGNIFKVIF